MTMVMTGKIVKQTPGGDDLVSENLQWRGYLGRAGGAEYWNRLAFNPPHKVWQPSSDGKSLSNPSIPLLSGFFLFLELIRS